MKLTISITAILFLLSLSSVHAQTTALRGIYVDGFSVILGNRILEDNLLQYAQDSSFNYLALYDMQAISFSDPSSVARLADFIRRAKLNFGVQYVGAVGESYSTFSSKIAPYNNGRTNPDERFNVFNLEFEFWTTSSVYPGGNYCTQYLIPNGCNCDTSGAFKFYIDQARKIKSLALTQGVLSETYIGWFTQEQGQQIAQNFDRILLHAYRTDASSVYVYSQVRLAHLASANSLINVVPIFSSEPDFMGPWLNSHSLTEPYSQYLTEFNADNSNWKQYINLTGYQWFDYGFMPVPIPGSGTGITALISASGPTTFCQGESVSLTASGGTTYLWSTGATTSSISVAVTGSYSCEVSHNGSSAVTSAINVLVNDAPDANFVNSFSSTGNIELSSTSAAGSASIISQQWYFNASNIASATGTSYTAMTDGDYSLEVIDGNGCSDISATQYIRIQGTTCQETTPQSYSVSDISPTSVMVSWENIPLCDSIIIRYENEETNTCSYKRIAYSDTNSIALHDIIPNANYAFSMMTSCGTNYSEYSVKKHFILFSSKPSLVNSPEERVRKVGAESQNKASELITFPNPAIDRITIRFHSFQTEPGNASFTDLSGRIVMSIPVEIIEGENSIEIEVSKLSSGIYFSGIESGSLSLTRRVIIGK